MPIRRRKRFGNQARANVEHAPKWLKKVAIGVTVREDWDKWNYGKMGAASPVRQIDPKTGKERTHDDTIG